MKTILLKSVNLLTKHGLSKANVRLCNRKIEGIFSAEDDVVADFYFDCNKLHLLPAGIDPHVHMELPTPAGNSCDDFLQGSIAALSGGTKAMIDFVTPHRGESLVAALLNRQKEAQKSRIPVQYHVGITYWDDSVAKEMRTCVEKYGIVSFKVYLAYIDSIGISFDDLEKAMNTAKELNAIIAIHAEMGAEIKGEQEKYIKNGQTSVLYHSLSRMPQTEYKAVQKVVELIRKTGCTTYIVHVSTAKSVEIIRSAKAEGLPVYAETCPHYLLLDDSKYEKEFEVSSTYVISPPLRKVEDQQALWEGMSDGTIDTIATDHCPFHAGQKAFGKDDFSKIPNGAGSVEYRLSLIYTFGVLTKKITFDRWIELCCTNAAQIFQRKEWGCIAVGTSIDQLILWDSEIHSEISAESSIQSCDRNIYEGMIIQGKALPIPE